MTGDRIGVEGAKSLSKTLKTNTALKELYLACEEEREKERERKKEFTVDRE